MKKVSYLIVFLLIILVVPAFGQEYKPNWKSLSKWEVPRWFDDAVIGIYCHWGVYSVPGFRFEDGEEQVDSGLWYGWFMYVDNEDEQPNFGVYDYHKATYGEPCEYNYHDLIPLWTAEKWNPDAWASLYKSIGADFIGLAGEHGDGFVLWDSEYDKFNSMDMGPKRDLLGELFESARNEGLKTVVTLHERPGWMFDAARDYCPDGVGANNPEYIDLYGETPFEIQNKKIKELIDNYRPDQIWFEDKYVGDRYWKSFLAYYFNSAKKWGKEVLIAQKHGEAPLSCSILDIEGGIFGGGEWAWEGMTEPQEQRWQKDVPIGNYWAYAEGVGCRPVNMLIDGVVDRVSKNGVTLFDVAPKPDGTLPEEQIQGLKEIGEWMAINKEALYAAKPANLVEGGIDEWRAGSIRFLEKEGYLYAIELGNEWPPTVGFGEYSDSQLPTAPFTIPGVKPLVGSEVKMLGHDTPLPWHVEGDNLIIDELPNPLPNDYAWSFKILIATD